MHKATNVKSIGIGLLLGTFSLFPMALGAQTYNETGHCSFYADKFQGRNCASGEKYDKNQFTAAHRTLPFNTLVKVTNLRNNKSVIVRINDRGPMSTDRLLDLSGAAAKSLDMIAYGVIDARIEYVGMADADSVKQALAAQKAEVQQKLELAKEREKEMKKPYVKKTETATNTELSDHTYYSQDYKTAVPGGFGVQVGFFSSLSNCRNAMHHFEGKYSVKSFMYVEKRNDGTFYRLILGQFNNKASADRFRSTVVGEVKDCFIVDYSAIK